MLKIKPADPGSQTDSILVQPGYCTSGTSNQPTNWAVAVQPAELTGSI